ncbi:MAG: hypothetical protein ACN6OB_05320 [Chryseobacterium jejuense]|uniref:hypothetical protein n=1 Tax=Chryseobacterium jejuense TaxID=445960 RepID=UPI003D1220C4
MKNIEKMHKLMNRKIYVLFGFLFFIFSCNKNNEYYLRSSSDKNTLYKIKDSSNYMVMTEHDNTKNITKSKMFLKENHNYVLKASSGKSYIFFSTNIHKDLIKDDFSLLNDSLTTGNKEKGGYYTEIKSNNKPVLYKYYYDETLRINKIEYKIGNKVFKYE